MPSPYRRQLNEIVEMMGGYVNLFLTLLESPVNCVRRTSSQSHKVFKNKNVTVVVGSVYMVTASVEEYAIV